MVVGSGKATWRRRTQRQYCFVRGPALLAPAVGKVTQTCSTCPPALWFMAATSAAPTFAPKVIPCQAGRGCLRSQPHAKGLTPPCTCRPRSHGHGNAQPVLARAPAHLWEAPRLPGETPGGPTTPSTEPAAGAEQGTAGRRGRPRRAQPRCSGVAARGPRGHGAADPSAPRQRTVAEAVPTGMGRGQRGIRESSPGQ